MAKHPLSGDGAKNGYDVGYGKPPVATRFKRGQSGNPKGRPKGSKSLLATVQEQLDAKILVKEGGRSKRMSKGEIGTRKLVDKFARDPDLKTLTLLLKLSGIDLGELGARAASSDGHPEQDHTNETYNQARLDWYFEARRAAAEDDGTREARETDGPDENQTPEKDEDGSDLPIGTHTTMHDGERRP